MAGEQGYTLADLRKANAPAGAEKFRSIVVETLRREFGEFANRPPDETLEGAGVRVALAYGVDPDARTRALIVDGFVDDEPTNWLDLILSVELTLAVRTRPPEGT